MFNGFDVSVRKNVCARAYVNDMRQQRKTGRWKKKKEREIKHDIITHFLPPCWQVIIKM